MYLSELSDSFFERCKTALNEEQTKSLSETNNWAHVDRSQVHADWDVLYKKIALHIETKAPSSEIIQEFVNEHYKIACRFYMPTEYAYIGMAIFYKENDGMKDFHNTYHHNMVEFLGDSISIYAHNKLKNT